MKINNINVYNNQIFKSLSKTVITIGMFDGVHKGHLELLNQINNYAINNNLESLLLTFSNHPKLILNQNSNLKLLTTNQEKIDILSNTNLKNLYIQDFTKEFKDLSAESFVADFLIQKLKMKALFIGYNHQFGKNREGNIEMLKILSEKYNFHLVQIPEIKTDDFSISSTNIRQKLLEGNIYLANKMLGYKYSITANVIYGMQLGRKLGFPTANLEVNPEKLLPKFGVYFVESYIKNQKIYGMMNIGIKPTLNLQNPTIEVHFFDFDENLYDSKITINLIEYIREEQKFDSIDSLKQQLKKDENIIRSKIHENN